jgi:hypothetical protein
MFISDGVEQAFNACVSVQTKSKALASEVDMPVSRLVHSRVVISAAEAALSRISNRRPEGLLHPVA